MTYQDEETERGLEADESYAREKDKLIPDVALEVVVTRGLLDNKRQRNDEGWAVYMFLAMVVAGAGYSLTFVESGPHRRMRELQLAAANASSRVSERESAPDATDDEANLGALSLEQSKELEAATFKLEKVLRFSRCEQLQPVWAKYTSVVQRLKGYESVMEQYVEHRTDAMTTCRVLPSQLAELP